MRENMRSTPDEGRPSRVKFPFARLISACLCIVMLFQLFPDLRVTAYAAGYSLTVTTAADSGSGSLRAAVAAVQSGQTIGFSAALKDQTITLESALDVPAGASIDGAGAPGLIIAVKAAGYDHLRSAGSVNLYNLSFVGLGVEVKDAGGIYAGGDLQMENCRILNTYGGGIYAGTNMTLKSCEIMGNIAEAGAVYDGAKRIGVVRAVNLTLTDTTVRGNGGNGRSIIVATNSLNMAGSTVDGNTCTNQGGGIYVGDAGGTVANSEISYNITSQQGGGIFFFGAGTITNSKIVGNGGGDGGGVYALTNLTVTNSEIRGNGGANGGGLCVMGKVTMRDTTVESNYATGLGGGAYLCGGTVQASTFAHNRAESSGGGLFSPNVTEKGMAVDNSTFAYNHTKNDGGGIGAHNADISYTTVTGNFAGTPNAFIMPGKGAGVYIDGGSLSSCIVAGNYNSSNAVKVTDSAGNEEHYPASNKYADVYLRAACTTTGNQPVTFNKGGTAVSKTIIGADVRYFMDFSVYATGPDNSDTEVSLYVGRLASNGGATQTVALFSAVDTGIGFQYDRDRVEVTTDQRGTARDGRLDNPGSFYYLHPYRITLEGDPPLDKVPTYESKLTSEPIQHRSLRLVLDVGMALGERDIVVDMSVDHVVVQETAAAKEAREARERRDLATRIAVMAVVVIAIAVVAAVTCGVGSTSYLAFAPYSGVGFSKVAATTTALTIASAAVTVAAFTAGFALLGASLSMMEEIDESEEEPGRYTAAELDNKRSRLMTHSLSISNYGETPTVTPLSAESQYQSVAFTIGGVILDSPLTWNATAKMNSLTLKGKTEDGKPATLLSNRYGGRVIETDSAQTIILENLVISGSCIAGPGGAIYAPNADLILRNCYFYGNSALGANGRGGAVYAKNVTLDGCVFEDNYAGDRGGAIYGDDIKITNATFENNRAGFVGGAVDAMQADGERVIFRGNSAPHGAAAAAYNGINLTTAEISGNSGKNSAVRADDIVLSNATVAGNDVASAVSALTSATLISSTVSANAGVGAEAPGVSLFASIVAGNGGEDISSDTFTASLSLTGIPQDDLPALMETIYAIIGGKTFIMGRLADNGGFGNTIAINPLGPAGNAIEPARAQSLRMPKTDGRGVKRSLGGEKYDIGAFESRVFTTRVSTMTPSNLDFLSEVQLQAAHSNLKGNTIRIENPTSVVCRFTGDLNILNNVTIIATPNAAGGPGIVIEGALSAVDTLLLDEDGTQVRHYSDIIRVANIGFENSSRYAIATTIGSGRLEAYNCAFTGNRNGAIQARNLVLSNCLFMNNTTTSSQLGGAITLIDGTGGHGSVITNCTFHGNTAPYGSAVLRRSGHTMPLTFISNTMTGNIGNGAISGVTPERMADFRYNIIYGNYMIYGPGDVEEKSFGDGVNPADMHLSADNVVAGVTTAANQVDSIFAGTQVDANQLTIGEITDFGGGRFAVVPSMNNPALWATFDAAHHANLPLMDALSTPRISETDDQICYGAVEVTLGGGAATELAGVGITSAKAAPASQQISAGAAGTSLGQPVYDFEMLGYRADDVVITASLQADQADTVVEYHKKTSSGFVLVGRAEGQNRQMTLPLDEGDNCFRVRVRSGAMYKDHLVNVARHARVGQSGTAQVDYAVDSQTVTLSGPLLALADAAQAADDRMVKLGGTARITGDNADAFEFQGGPAEASIGDSGSPAAPLTLRPKAAFPAQAGTLEIRVVPTNGEQTGYTIPVPYDGSGFLRYISEAEIPDVSVPSAGATGGATLSTAEYTGTVRYKYTDADEMLDAGDLFALGVAYTAVISLAPKAGYTLSGLPENFFQVAGTVLEGATYADGTVYAPFPPAPAFTPEKDLHYTTTELLDGWTATDYTVTAKVGYALSLSDALTGNSWTPSLVWDENTTDGLAAFYVKNTTTGEISGVALEAYKLNKLPPTLQAWYNGEERPVAQPGIEDKLYIKRDGQNGVHVAIFAFDGLVPYNSKLEYCVKQAPVADPADIAAGDWIQGEFAGYSHAASFDIAKDSFDRDNPEYHLYMKVTTLAGTVAYFSDTIVAFDDGFVATPLPSRVYPLDLGQDLECRVVMCDNVVTSIEHEGVALVSGTDVSIVPEEDKIILHHDYLQSLADGYHEFTVSYDLPPRGAARAGGDLPESSTIAFSTAPAGVKMWYDIATPTDLPVLEGVTLDFGTIDVGYIEAPSRPFTITNTAVGVSLFGLDMELPQDSQFDWTFPFSGDSETETFPWQMLDPGLDYNAAVWVAPKPGLPVGAYTETATVVAYTQPGSTEDEYRIEAEVTVTCVVGDAKPGISAAPLPEGTFGDAYTHTLAASGSGPIRWRLTGSLPAGLRLNATTGVISGRPSAAGTFTFTVSAENSLGTDTVTHTVTIKSGAPVIRTTALPNGTEGQAYSSTLTADSGEAVTWFRTEGSLPTGLVLSSTGALSGTPELAGSFTFTLAAANENGGVSTRDFSITIAEAGEPGARPITGLRLDRDALTLAVGDSRTLVATVLPEDTTDDATVTWRSSNPEVASVEAGVVRAHTAGTATITAEAGGESDSCEVTVVRAAHGAITLSHSYLALPAGGEAQVSATHSLPGTPVLAMAVEMADRKTPSAHLSVTPGEAPGVFVIKGLTAGKSAIVRFYTGSAAAPDQWADCRVDVVDGDAKAEFALATKTATLDIHRAAPSAAFTVLRTTPGAGRPAGLAGGSLSIVPAGSAKAVTVQDLVDHFEVRAADDQTAVLVPRAESAGKLDSLNSSYKFQFKLSYSYKGEAEEYLIPGTATLKLNRKLPALKADTVNINTHYAPADTPIIFTGAESVESVRAVTADEHKKHADANDKILGVGGWLSLDGESATLRLTGDKTRYSGTLYLMAKLAGWAAEVAVSVKVNGKATAPGVKLASAKAKVYLGAAYTGTPMQLKPKSAKARFEEMGITGVAMAANANPKTYKVQGLYDVTGLEPDGSFKLVPAAGMAADDLKGGKVLLAVQVRDGRDIELPVTVSLIRADARVTLKPDRAAFTLNPNLTGGEAFAVTVSTNIPGYDLGDGLKAEVVSGGASYQPGEAGCPLDVTISGGRVTVATNAETPIGAKVASHKLRLTLPGVNAGKDATINLNVKTSKLGTQAGVSLSAKGKVDLTSGAGADLTAKFTNYLGGFADAIPSFVVTTPDGAVMSEAERDAAFEISQTAPNSWRIAPRAGGSLVTGNYTVAIGESAIAGGSTLGTTKAAVLKVAAGKPKLTFNTKAVTLYSSDPYSEETLSVRTAPEEPDIRKISIKNADASAFELLELGGGRYAIGFKNDAVGGRARSATLTLEVHLAGNNSARAVTTVKIKVTVKSF